MTDKPPSKSLQISTVQLYQLNQLMILAQSEDNVETVLKALVAQQQ